MDEITSPTPEPVSPELAAIDAYLTKALRTPPLEIPVAEVLAQTVIRRSDGAGGGRASRVRTARVAGGRAAMLGEGKRRGLGRRTLRGKVWFGAGVAMILLMSVLIWPASFHRPGTTATYATGIGQQATVTLEDGTHLTLAPQTTLRLMRFGTRARTVDLDGEAYIEVAHTTGAPFVVQSNGVTVQVLGTAFLLRHYRDERSVHVAVATGKVRVQSRMPVSTPVILIAGHVADVSDSTIKTLAIDESVSNADWVDGKLSFYNKPLPQVLATLSRWYGYEFRVSDSTLTQARVTLVLSTRSSTTMLALLEQLLSVNLSVVGDTVTLARQTVRPAGVLSRLHNYDVWTPTREAGR